MATSPFFQNYDYFNEQSLLEQLVIEGIQKYGMDMFYLPRRRDTFDGVYYEDDTNYFDTAYEMEMYVRSNEGFMGQGSLMTKFGIEMRDEAVFTIARRRFEQEITEQEQDIERPREGDLIFFPMNNRIFKINYVDNKPFFYQLGELQMYDVTVELWEYSQERLETGIDAIDRLQRTQSFNVYDHAILDANGGYITDAEGKFILTAASYDEYQEQYEDNVDNKRIEDESNRNAVDANDSLIVWDETNPFVNSTDGKY